jgi:hypothetical protein
MPLTPAPAGHTLAHLPMPQVRNHTTSLAMTGLLPWPASRLDTGWTRSTPTPTLTGAQTPRHGGSRRPQPTFEVSHFCVKIHE